MEFKLVWTLLLDILIVGSILNKTHAQDNEIEDVGTPATKLESTVVSDMLSIVDKKFDTITTRISTLERAISNLQYYSIRQFQDLSTFIRNTQKDVHTVHKKMDNLEVDGRALKISMSLLGANVADLKTTSSRVLGELESSVLYINDNVDKQAETLKKQMHQSTNATARTIEKHFRAQKEEALATKKAQEGKLLNCSVDFSELAERIDVRFSEFKQQTYDHCAKLLDDARSQSVSENLRRAAEADAFASMARNAFAEESLTEAAAFSSAPEDTMTRLVNDVLNGNRKKTDSPTENETTGSRQAEDVAYDDRIMDFLFNMTTSVLQATSYFRHSERVMEEILSNTGILVAEQTHVKNELENVKTSLIGQNGADTERTRLINNIPDRRGNYKNPGDIPNMYNPSWPRHGGGYGVKECRFSATAMRGLETIVKNGSQLLEVLTDLAHLSSMSLTTATTSLQGEVKKVENFHTQMTSTMMSKVKEIQSIPAIEANTEKILKVVEAVASNTGWLPRMLRDVQLINKMVNRSSHTMSSNNQILYRIYQLQTADAKLANAEKERKALDNRIGQVPSPTRTGDVTDNDIPGSESTSDRCNDATSAVSGSGREYTLDKASLEIMSKTSQELQRIMPALTRLLAEPEPLFTLVGGKQSDQGRLEIYNRGQWGTMCHEELSHQDADAICRHIGYPGGISAGAGHFGPGTGIAWTIDTFCLRPSEVCAKVKQLEDASLCNHDNDVAIICDHMLRIGEGDGSENKKGRLEIHHKGLWQPICSEGWNSYSARVACRQMGFSDGRETELGEWLQGQNSTWFSNVTCRGTETRLDVCPNRGWMEGCARSVPAGVRCH